MLLALLADAAARTTPDLCFLSCCRSAAATLLLSLRCLQFLKVHIIPNNTIKTNFLPRLPAILPTAYEAAVGEAATVSLFR